MIETQVVASGGGAILNLHEPPYALHAEWRANEVSTVRKEMKSNRWVTGEHPASSVRGNVRETVSVWVEADTFAVMHAASRALRDVMLSKVWTLTITELEGGVATVVEVLTCFATETTVTTTQEYRYSTTALVKGDVERLPNAEVSYP